MRGVTLMGLEVGGIFRDLTILSRKYSQQRPEKCRILHLIVGSSGILC